MRKAILFLAVILALSAPSPARAQDFEQSFEARYKLLNTGQVDVNYKILLTNLTTEKYIEKYELSLRGLNPENIKANDSEGETNVSVKSDNLIINFENAVVGKNKTRILNLEFTDRSLLNRAGEVWEINLPNIQNANEFDNYSIEIIVPDSFGELAYIRPDTYSKSMKDAQVIYRFDKNNLKESAITAAFGQFQVFSFSLTYHLENPINKTAIIPIAIPPDTAFQKMIYNTIEPAPKNIKKDTDGNWIAEYELKAQENLDVGVSGHAQIFSEPYKKQDLTQKEMQMYLQPQPYWETNDPKIKSIAQNLNTPRKIYEFVVKTLSYDYDRIDPRVKRMGAVKALSFPDQAICMEFTDLFITLSRAAGIPAREINGFADTNNQKLQPLSLVADVLHSWPEYWDSQKQVWVPVDPTWADTTGGVDFFSKLDLKHFAFVIHGVNSQEPYPAGSYKLGAYPQKDVYVSLSHLPENRQPAMDLKISRGTNLSFDKLYFEIVVKNTGPVAIYNQALDIFADGEKIKSFKINTLLPHEQSSFKLDINSGFLASRAPRNLSASLQGFETEYEINKDQIVLRSITLIFFIIFSITAVLYWRLKRR